MCRQCSTFAFWGRKSAVPSALWGSFLQTVQHFYCPESQKCYTVYRKLHACADSTALLLPQEAKVLYCLHFEAVFSRQYSTFAARGHKSAVLSAEIGMHAQTVQHFCYPKMQKSWTVYTLMQFSVDSTALLLLWLAKVLYCLQKMACMRRQYSTFATPKSKSAVLSAQNPQNNFKKF